MSRLPPLPDAELDEVIRIVGDWGSLQGARLFITGGTGFFGKWLLESLGHANQELGLGLKATVLSRDPNGFLQNMAHLRDTNWLSFQAGDITSFQAPLGTFTHLLHGAASSDARDYAIGPDVMKRDIVEGPAGSWNSCRGNLHSACFS
ncbi:MAG: hypothetical protein IPP78_02665 [Holophagaceae bacterium]|nr:hypothetical protein [Holophagaceae bacterium]